MKLYLSNAISFVRSRVDELPYNNDDMISPADDDRNFDITVEKLLPEAAEFLFRAAPAELLEPSGQGEVTIDETGATGSGEVLETVSGALERNGHAWFRLDTLTTGLLRVISILNRNTGIHTTRYVPYDGPEARMQLNPYTKGTPDAPVVVFTPTREHLSYDYYSVDASHGTAQLLLRYITAPKLEADEVGRYIFCPAKLEYAVLNRLTAMLLDAYGDQRSQLFYQKSANYQL